VFGVPFNFRADKAGFRQLVSFIDEGYVLLSGSIVVRVGLLQSDPSLVKKFIRATLKGFLYARNNRSGTIAILARKIKIKEDLAAKIYDMARPAMTQDGTVSVEVQKKALEPSLDIIGLEKSPPLERFFDFSMTRKIRADIEAKGWAPGR